jgi:hypothetical protein
MLAFFVRNKKIIQNTGVSFAIAGTTMHVLNVANLMSPLWSHTWSAIAIVGFCLTASSQTGSMLAGKMLRIRKRGNIRSNERNDVALP